MAKIISQTIAVTFSKLVKTGEDDSTTLFGDEAVAALEQVAQELAGSDIVVEVERA
jgi:hypothetical protein